ncbi:MAG: hypothetical protein HY329_25165 [Chloroflexi bacterium]|nr:hypothetical protein [Chloroflexota bacterium]
MLARLRRVSTRLAFLGIGIIVGASTVMGVNQATAQSQTTSWIPWTPPAGVIRVSGCVPNMGEHWANPAQLPMGPIYTVDNGRLISIEYMPSQEFFRSGQSVLDLPFTYHGTQLPINHANVEFQPRGHEGYEVPHYDMHFHVVSFAEERAITCQQSAFPLPLPGLLSVPQNHQH